MSGGQWLVFWCCVAGLTVIALTEWFRWRHHGPRRLGRSANGRLLDELRRQP